MQAPNARNATAPLLRKSTRLLSALGLTATLAPALAASAGDVSGHLEMARGEAASPTANFGAYMRPKPNGVLPTRSLDSEASGRAVAVIVKAGAASAATQKHRCALEIVNGAFRSAVTAFAVGATPEVKNADGTSYRLASGAGAPLVVAAGARASLPALSEGATQLRALAHPHLAVTVHAVPGLVACASVDSRGDFLLRDLAEGAYTLKIYTSEGVALERPIAVKRFGAAALGKLKVP